MGKLLITLAVATSCMLTASDIQGSVHITRPLTKKRIVVDTYALRGGAAAAASQPEDLDEWARTVIYLDVALPQLQADNVDVTPPQISQRNRRFAREVLVIPAGTTVSFPNDDPIFHNVFSLSKAKSFDLGYYRQGQSRNIRFDKPGPVNVFCHLHPNMNASILVVPNAFYTQPAPSGAFKISNVPPGRYTLRLWHKSAGYLQEEIAVPVEGIVDVSFRLPLATAKP